MKVETEGKNINILGGKAKDLITLQDPTNVKKFNISMFYHIQNNVKVEMEGKNINI